MRDYSDLISNFFLDVARRERNTLEQLRHSGFTITQDEWRFLLPEVHDFLSSQAQPAIKASYNEFRQQLFKLSINRVIRPYGAAITIHDNLNHVNQSRYVMTWGNNEYQ